MLNKLIGIFALISCSTFSLAFEPIGKTNSIPVYFMFEEGFNLSTNPDLALLDSTKLVNLNHLYHEFKAGIQVAKFIDLRAGLALSHIKAPAELSTSADDCPSYITNCNNFQISIPQNKLILSANVPFNFSPQDDSRKGNPLYFGFEAGIKYLIPTHAQSNDSRVDLNASGLSPFLNMSVHTASSFSDKLTLTGSMGYSYNTLNIEGVSNGQTVNESVSYLGMNISLILATQI